MADAPKAITRVDDLMMKIESRRLTIEKLLPVKAPVNIDRFVTQVRMALVKNPKLQECQPQSIIESVLTAAELGLDPSGRLGSAYLVPYKDKCQLIPGYRGLIDLAVRSGEVKAINAWLVREKDEFDYVAGKPPWHKPYIPKPGQDEEPGPVWCAYAVATLGDGKTKQEQVMSLKELMAIKARSPSAKSNYSPWHTDPEEMMRKSTVRKLCKYLPLSPEKARLIGMAMELDEAEIEPEKPEPTPGNGGRTQSLKEALTTPIDAEWVEATPETAGRPPDDIPSKN